MLFCEDLTNKGTSSALLTLSHCHQYNIKSLESSTIFEASFILYWDLIRTSKTNVLGGHHLGYYKNSDSDNNIYFVNALGDWDKEYIAKSGNSLIIYADRNAGHSITDNYLTSKQFNLNAIKYYWVCLT